MSIEKYTQNKTKPNYHLLTPLTVSPHGISIHKK